MSAQRFSIVVSGVPCAAGLSWPEARLEAARVVARLGHQPGAVVTVSESSLDEPHLSYRCTQHGWTCRLEPSWSDAAA